MPMTFEAISGTLKLKISRVGNLTQLNFCSSFCRRNSQTIRTPNTITIMSILITTMITEQKENKATITHLTSIIKFSDDTIMSKTLNNIITS